MRKIIKSSNTDQANTFRLHYFPNIPVGGASGETAAEAPGENAPDAPRIRRGSEEPWHSLGGGAGGQQRRAEEAQAQLTQMAKKAYAEGFAQGERDARDLADKRLAPLRATLENTLSELQRAREKIHRQIEQEVVDLALHIARKLVGRELSVNPEAILCVVQEALKQTDNPARIQIRLNPTDLAQLKKLSAAIDDESDEADRPRFIADTSINGGGCLIETDFGEIDARIEEQFRTLEEAFRAELMQPSLPE